MDNKDNTSPNRPYEQKFTLQYPCGYKMVDGYNSRPDSSTNRAERPIPTIEFREKRHGQ